MTSGVTSFPAIVVGSDAGRSAQIQRALLALGATVSVADRLRACELALEPWALVVLDIEWPDLAGTELCWLFAQQTPQPLIVALVKGAGTGRDGFSLAHAGAAEMIEEPFDLGVLIAVVTRRRSPLQKCPRPPAKRRRSAPWPQ